MTDYILITPDGQLTEKTGYPARDVDCHGYSGQTLIHTRTGTGRDQRALRLQVCDCSAIMPDQHPENPVATRVIGVLGYPITFYGNVAIYTVGWDNEPIQMTPEEIARVQSLAAVTQQAADLGITVTVVDTEA